MTEVIYSSFLKTNPPTSITLTGSSDPCYSEAYHLSDSSDGRITLHLKVVNLTELELNRVDIRVGLSGSLYFMDGYPQAVRQLRNLISQDPVFSCLSVGVSHFERCSLWLQVLYYPFYESGGTGDYNGDYTEKNPQIMRQKRGLKQELGEPVILGCQPYEIALTDLLLPHKISPVEYFRLWPSSPAIFGCTGTHIYEGSGFKATAAQQYGESPFLSGLKSLPSKSFHCVCSHVLQTVSGFQMALWNTCLKRKLRTQLHRERLRKCMVRIALLKAAKPQQPPNIEEEADSDEDEEKKRRKKIRGWKTQGANNPNPL